MYQHLKQLENIFTCNNYSLLEILNITFSWFTEMHLYITQMKYYQSN